MSKAKQTMGGTAIFQFNQNVNGYLVAMTGDFDGGVFARVIGEPRDVGNGRTELDLEHYFIRKDGSTISTRDQSVLQTVPGSERLAASTTYNVVNATGSFEGMKGTFQSWGALDPSTGQGILRFWGHIGTE